MVVKSILDTDLYKFTTSYAYMKLSDDLGKHTGDTEEVKHCIQTISKF